MSERIARVIDDGSDDGCVHFEDDYWSAPWDEPSHVPRPGGAEGESLLGNNWMALARALTQRRFAVTLLPSDGEVDSRVAVAAGIRESVRLVFESTMVTGVQVETACDALALSTEDAASLSEAFWAAQHIRGVWREERYREERRAERTLVKSVACDYCGAKAGSPCRSASGARAEGFHKARDSEAHAAAWRAEHAARGEPVPDPLMPARRRWGDREDPLAAALARRSGA